MGCIQYRNDLLDVGTAVCGVHASATEDTFTVPENGCHCESIDMRQLVQNVCV